MTPKYNISISLIPVFADKSKDQTSKDYYKILLDNENKIITRSLMASHHNLEDCLHQIFSEFLKIDYNWAMVTLAGCRKVNTHIELLYVSNAIYMNNCNKDGLFVNTNDFMSLITDNYYAEKI
jgi:hypothetical protein